MTVEEKVRALAMLDGPALRQSWLELCHAQPPRVSPKLLRLGLAYRIQAHAFGDLSPASQLRLGQLANGKTKTRKTAAGMRLVREWQGQTHIVTIESNGSISWDGRTWKSLSAVARAITGGHWSGPAFFGLRKRKL
jgi:hypothetical protein